MAQPADARGELENGRFVRNRIVVVERGNIPIVHKVTHASLTFALRANYNLSPSVHLQVTTDSPPSGRKSER